MEPQWQPREFQESLPGDKNVEGKASRQIFQEIIREALICLYFTQHLTHKNIATLLNSFLKDNKLYLVVEFMQDNLNNIIRTQRLPNDDIRYIIYQILSGLNYLHNCGIIHGDLKPSDIGINRDFTVKIIDLNTERPKETDYVLTKWFVERNSKSCFAKFSHKTYNVLQVSGARDFIRMENINREGWFMEPGLHLGWVFMWQNHLCRTWS